MYVMYKLLLCRSKRILSMYINQNRKVFVFQIENFLNEMSESIETNS